VEAHWVKFYPNKGIGAPQQFVDSLKQLKHVIVQWDIAHRKSQEKFLLDIKEYLAHIYDCISLR
jgi:hypothetical protein